MISSGKTSPQHKGAELLHKSFNCIRIMFRKERKQGAFPKERETLRNGSWAVNLWGNYRMSCHGFAKGWLLSSVLQHRLEYESLSDKTASFPISLNEGSPIATCEIFLQLEKHLSQTLSTLSGIWISSGADPQNPLIRQLPWARHLCTSQNSEKLIASMSSLNLRVSEFNDFT